MEIDISSHLYTTAFTAPIVIVTSLIAIAVFLFGVLLSIQAGMKKGRFLVAFVSLLGVMVVIAGTLFAGFAGADWLNHNAGNREKIRTSTVVTLFEEEFLQEIEPLHEEAEGPQLRMDPVLNVQDGAAVDVVLESGRFGVITVDGNAATLELSEQLVEQTGA